MGNTAYGDIIKPKNKNKEIKLRIIMLEYSAKKINANHPPINSTLNPDTNSDSPSAKSKGLRFTSARHLINQIKNIIIFPQKSFNKIWVCVIIKTW